MISDTLHLAASEVRDYLRDFPDTYAGVRPAIDALLAEMDGVVRALDTPPAPRTRTAVPITAR